MSTEPTYELLKRAQAGDAQAFGELLERYRARLATLVRVRLGPPLAAVVEVEDILQETSLQGFRSIARFQWINEGSFYRWLACIAENVIRNKARELRKPAVQPPLTVVEEIAAPDGVSPLRRLLRQERFERLQKALQSLSPDHREVIILARLEGLPMQEVARRLDRSVDAASMLLLRALRQLKRLFGTTGSLGLPDLSLQAPQESSTSLTTHPESPEPPPDLPLILPASAQPCKRELSLSRKRNGTARLRLSTGY